MKVGTRVKVVAGMFEGRQGVITEIIKVEHEKEVRYDISCVPGRWYYADELEVLEEEEIEHE